ncbi:hypothetical protein [Desulfotomaculum sp. 1211_IL3151]|uniref:hypothetical protein n=1 Tax=Desulfotomaculum sp. 1211_IL3151 TaxID=3084055 RepID=UPI002FD9769E
MKEKSKTTCNLTRICPRCGYPMEIFTLVCPRCREPIPGGCSGNCSKCGTKK